MNFFKPRINKAARDDYLKLVEKKLSTKTRNEIKSNKQIKASHAQTGVLTAKQAEVKANHKQSAVIEHHIFIHFN